jgi:hypothetical protein
MSEVTGSVFAQGEDSFPPLFFKDYKTVGCHKFEYSMCTCMFLIHFKLSTSSCQSSCYHAMTAVKGLISGSMILSAILLKLGSKQETESRYEAV